MQYYYGEGVFNHKVNADLHSEFQMPDFAMWMTDG
jgi:hypothetical protein